MKITFNLPHVFQEPLSNELADANALKALLGCLVLINLDVLRAHPYPPLYESGVRYGRTTLWEPIPALYARQRGDCKSLATARVAELRMRGVRCRPCFRGDPRSEHTNWHILVEVAKNPKYIGILGLTEADVKRGYEDPSKKLGMLDDPTGRFYYDTFGSELVNPVRALLDI